MYNNGNSSKNVTGASVVDGTLENADFADNTISGDKIDAGIISNFQSTGIDDRLSTTKNLTLTDSTTTSTNTMVVESLNKGRVYSFSKGHTGGISNISIDLGGAGNATDSVIVEIVATGYNARIIDYIYTRHNGQTAQMKDRISSSSAIPTVTSGTGEQHIFNIADGMIHPVVKVTVTAGGYIHNNAHAINPTITFS